MDREIIIIPDDRGGKTVEMDRKDYVTKAKQPLSDRNTYKVVQEDEFRQLLCKITKTAEKRKDLSAISQEE